MKSHVVLSAALVAACTLAAAAGHLLVDRLSPVGSASPLSLPDEQRRSRQLDGKLANLRQSNEAKQALTADVIAGRRTLFEVAAMFQALDAQNPDFCWPMFCRMYSGDSDGERYCRCVFRWVERHLPEDSSQAEQILTRLETELEARLREHGNIVLLPVVSTQ